MFRREELNELLEVYARHEEFEERLKKFCEPSALALGFLYVTSVAISGNYVTFVAEWHGGHGSENSKAFSFEVGMLADGPEAVKDWLMGIQEQYRIEAIRLRAERQKESDRILYEKLRPQFEGENKSQTLT